MKEIIDFVCLQGCASAYALMDQFQITYPQAVHLIDDLEERNIIAPVYIRPDGSQSTGPRSLIYKGDKALQFAQPFNAASVEPQGSFPQWPLAPNEWAKVAIVSTEVVAPEGKGGFLRLEVQILEGAQAGYKCSFGLNLWHQNETTSRIAWSNLSSICHVTGKMVLQNSDELVNIPFWMTGKTDGTYNNFSQFKDLQGTAPGKKAAGSAPPATPAATAGAPSFGPPSASAAPPAAAPAPLPWEQPKQTVPAQQPAPPAAPPMQLSEDKKWAWDGAKWIPNPALNAAPPAPPAAPPTAGFTQAATAPQPPWVQPGAPSWTPGK